MHIRAYKQHPLIGRKRWQRDIKNKVSKSNHVTPEESLIALKTKYFF